MSIKRIEHLGLLGAGHMGAAMLNGWLDKGLSPSAVQIYDPYASPRIVELSKTQGMSLNPDISSIEKLDILVVALKPQILEKALTPYADFIARTKPLVISVAAGINIVRFEKILSPSCSIIRAMPNIPASIGLGMTGLVKNANVTTAQSENAIALMEAVGKVVMLNNEAEIDALTAVSGSGPGYIFYLGECMVNAGIACGLSPEVSQILARATLAGAGGVIDKSEQSLDELWRSVALEGGTTIAGLNVLMHEDRLKSLMEQTVKAARDRAEELSGI